MHEYSIARALLERVKAEADARGATAVRSVAVRIGELSGVDADLLATAYRTLTEGTVCERSALGVTTVQVRWVCRSCGGTIGAGGPLRCEACDGAAVLAQGDEILLERIEMDVANDREEPAHVRAGRI